MYFVPQKNKWYSPLVHTRALYRYGMLIFIAVAIALLWRYGLYTWLDAAITQEQGAIAQLENQLVAQAQLKRDHEDMVSQMPVLQNACSRSSQMCIGPECYDQCSYIFDQASKAGLRITHYHNEKEKKNEYKQSQFASLGLYGPLDYLQNFLAAVKKSGRMIQCRSLSLQAAENNNVSASCMIQFISPVNT